MLYFNFKILFLKSEEKKKYEKWDFTNFSSIFLTGSFCNPEQGLKITH